VVRQPAIQLHIPASARYLRLARLTAAGLAGELGYTTEAVEDVRVAVDELCSAIIDDASATTELALVYRPTPAGLIVEGTCRAEGSVAPALDEMAQDLLARLADEYSIAAVDGQRTFRLLKYAV
jgi:serine/threonine-protein kinase RsbW